MTDHSPRGLIMLAATPVGNAGDASARLVDALATSDVIAAEDTRRLRALLSRLAVDPQGQIVSFYEGNESARVPELIERASAGARVLVVTDAGMPSISDPGFRLVREAHESDVDITCLPGPSAALAALVLSGLPVARFAFEGFLPRKDGDRRRRLASLATEERTMVFFEAPHRLGARRERTLLCNAARSHARHALAASSRARRAHAAALGHLPQAVRSGSE